MQRKTSSKVDMKVSIFPECVMVKYTFFADMRVSFFRPFIPTLSGSMDSTMDAATVRLGTRILILALIIGAPRPRTFQDRQGICPDQCSGLSLPPRLRVLLRLHCILVTGFGESFLGSLPSGRAALSLSSRFLPPRTLSEL